MKSFWPTAAILFVGGMFSSEGLAHDFWIQPDAFRVRQGDQVTWALMVGHASDRQISTIPRDRIRRFEVIGTTGEVDDLVPLLIHGTSGGEGAFQLQETGTFVLSLETDHSAISRLPARIFNDYLVLEGLTPALQYRKRNKATGEQGAERYGRRAKAIVRAGSAIPQRASVATRPLGLSLEIVPAIDPLALRTDEKLPIYVSFKSKPLVGALVKLTDLDDDEMPVSVQRTGRKGDASIELPRHGRWLLSVVWTEKLSAGEDVDFDTTFSSLAFEN